MLIEKRETTIPGCFELFPKVLPDSRGYFIKTFHETVFAELGLPISFPEEYFSFSHKGVLRGLHFQTPPFEHSKIVYCVQGSVLDVVVDLRKDSEYFGKHQLFKLNHEEANMIYIPPGLAHGFFVESHFAIMMYKLTSVYEKNHDKGIRWNSLEISWPEPNPIVSERDRNFIKFCDFESPF